MAETLDHAFELHHCIEQNNVFERSELLQELKRNGLYDVDSSRNTVYLPSEKTLGAQLGISPHPGGHLHSYTKIVVDELQKIERGADWQSYMEQGDKDAMRRVAERVHVLEDTLKTALVNGDLYTNNTHGIPNTQTLKANQSFQRSIDGYGVSHAEQIAQIGRLESPEAQWVSVLQSEQQTLRATEIVNRPGYKPAGGEEFDGHASLRKAINQAHAGGRLNVSDQATSELRQAFSPHVAQADAREAASASRATARGAALRSLVVGGVAVSLADAADASERISSSLDQDNPLAAKSHAVHYAGRGAGGVIGGAAAGLIAGSWTGPGVLLTVAAGAYTGSEAGEKLAKMWDNRQVYHQVRDNVSWEFTGRQWVRERTADLSRDDVSNANVTTFAAPPEKARELYLDALNAATALELKNVPLPRSPFIQPQAPGDTPSLDPASWERNSRTDQWERNVVVGRLDHGANTTRPEVASPERAAQLDRAADQVIRENIANGQAPIASRYEIAFRASGFDSVGEKLPAATNALTEGYLEASNGDLYRRDGSGQWLSQDGTPAPGNLPLELERTNAELAPQLAQHRQYVAALSPMQPPVDRDRAILLDTYLQRGVEPTQQQMDAAMLAIARTREANDIAPGMTTYQLEPNVEKTSGEKKYDVTSSIAHVYRYSDGVPRIAAVTTAAEIDQARAEMQGRAAPIPNTPELRIEALSPQQRDAQEQALREANRMGLSRDDVQFAAQHAAAAAIAADREPEIVIVRDDIRVRAPTPEPRREPETPSPEISKPPPPTAAPESPPEQREGQAPTEDSRKSIEPAHAAVSEAQPPLAPPTAPPAPHLVPSTPAAPVASDDALQRDSEGQDVALLQYRLDRMGYRGPEETPLPQHGRFDAATEHGVRQFQEANRLPATGMVDPDTVQALAVAQQSRAVRPAADASPETAALAQEPPQKAQRPDPVASAEEPAPVAPAPSEAPPQPKHEHRQPATADDELVHTAPPDQAITQAPATASPRDPFPTDDAERRHELAATAQAREPVSEPFAPSVAQAPVLAGTPRPSARNDEDQTREPSQHARNTGPEPAFDRSQIAPRDQPMFDKIRNGAPLYVSDETVALAMLEAKRNGIPDADRMKEVGITDGKLWVGSVTPGYYGVVSTNGPAPPIEETLRETQAVNQQHDQKVAQDREMFAQQEAQRQTDAMRPQI